MWIHTNGRMAYNWETGRYDCHFTRHSDNKNTPPRIRSRRSITKASYDRFLRVSGGFLNVESRRGQDEN